MAVIGWMRSFLGLCLPQLAGAQGLPLTGTVTEMWRRLRRGVSAPVGTLAADTLERRQPSKLR